MPRRQYAIRWYRKAGKPSYSRVKAHAVLDSYPGRRAMSWRSVTVCGVEMRFCADPVFSKPPPGAPDLCQHCLRVLRDSLPPDELRPRPKVREGVFTGR